MTDLVRLRYRNQLLAQTPIGDPAQVVAHFLAMQAQDYLGALWAVGLRTRGASEASVEQALAAGRLVRSWPLRGTLHFVAAADLRWLLALLGGRVLARARRRLAQLEIDGKLVARAADAFTRALEGGRRLTRDGMRAALESADIDCGGQRGYHLLWCCALEGVICLGPRQGKRQTFVLLEEWVPPSTPLARDEALARLAARYFTAHGPASARDFGWWTGLPAAEARLAIELAAAHLTTERVRGETLYAADSTLTLPRRRTPAVHLLPAFDEYLVGYTDRRAVLPPAHARRVNNGGGLLAPVITLRSRVVGTWKRTLSRSLVRVQGHLFQAVPPDDARSLEATAAEYGRFLGLDAEFKLDAF